MPVLDGERASIAGVPGRASPILLDFVAPSGARTGQLLPTGRPQEAVNVFLLDSREVTLPVSLVDATNPTVFTTDWGLRSALGIPNNAPINYVELGVVDALERVRQAGARLMGLDPFAQAQPKVTVLKPASLEDGDADIVVNAFSMGVLHRAVPMTVGLCLGVAACVPRTLAWEAVRGGQHDTSELLRIRHPSGVVEVGAGLVAERGGVMVARGKGRFEGGAAGQGGVVVAGGKGHFEGEGAGREGVVVARDKRCFEGETAGRGGIVVARGKGHFEKGGAGREGVVVAYQLLMLLT